MKHVFYFTWPYVLSTTKNTIVAATVISQLSTTFLQELQIHYNNHDGDDDKEYYTADRQDEGETICSGERIEKIIIAMIII